MTDSPVQIASTDNPSGNCLCEFQRCSLWQKPLYKSLFKLEVLFKCVLTVMVCCVVRVDTSYSHRSGVVSRIAVPREWKQAWADYPLLPFCVCHSCCPILSVKTSLIFQIPYFSVHRTRRVFLGGTMALSIFNFYSSHN